MPIYRQHLVSHWTYALQVQDLGPDCQVLQNEVLCSILKAPRTSLRQRTHLALGVWRLDALTKYRRLCVLVHHLQPTRANELIAPRMLVSFREATARTWSRKRGTVPWMDGVLAAAREYKLIDRLEEIVEEHVQPYLAARSRMPDEDADDISARWKSHVRSAVCWRERKWQLRDNRALEEHGKLWSTLKRKKHLLARHLTRPLPLFRGLDGYIGHMVATQPTQVPRWRGAALSLLWKRAGHHAPRHRRCSSANAIWLSRRWNRLGFLSTCHGILSTFYKFSVSAPSLAVRRAAPLTSTLRQLPDVELLRRLA